MIFKMTTPVTPPTPDEIQAVVNTLLTAYVVTGNGERLNALLLNNFNPSPSLDLLTMAAGIGSTGSGRQNILRILLTYQPTYN